MIHLTGYFQIVPSWSAIGWDLNAEKVLLNANHVSMVRFAGVEDQEYSKVWKKLVIMARDAPGKVALNWQEDSKEVPGTTEP